MSRWLIFAVFLMAGCTDRGHCLAKHYESSWYFQYTYDAKMNITGMYWVDTSGYVCDRWEFPNGRPEK